MLSPFLTTQQAQDGGEGEGERWEQRVVPYLQFNGIKLMEMTVHLYKATLSAIMNDECLVLVWSNNVTIATAYRAFTVLQQLCHMHIPSLLLPQPCKVSITILV